MKNAEQSVGGLPDGLPRSRRVSIVDDEEPVREALKSLLRSVHLHVDAECLILDLYLPGMNGFELQRHLNAESRAIPIIFITAHADDAARTRALKAGAVELLAKPVRREPLFRAIQSAIQS